jgi:hypothetical protein
MAVHLHRGRDRGCLALRRWRARSGGAACRHPEAAERLKDPMIGAVSEYPVGSFASLRTTFVACVRLRRSDAKPARQPKNDEHEHDQAGR